MAAYWKVDGLKSPAGSLPAHQDQFRAQHSIMNMEELYLYIHYLTMDDAANMMTLLTQATNLCWNMFP